MKRIWRSRVAKTRNVTTDVLRQAQAVATDWTAAAALTLVLLLAWIVGGATRSNTLQLAILESASLVCMAIVMVIQRKQRFPAGAQAPAFLMAALVVMAFLQLVPMPWQLWSWLPGHAAPANGLRLLGLEGGIHPLSLSPEDTVSGVVKFAPAVIVFWLSCLTPWRTLASMLAWWALVAGVFSTLWAGGQFFRELGPTYPWTDPGTASGPFANPNHLASFLLMCLPLIAVSAGQARQRSRGGIQGVEIVLLWISAGFILLLGIVFAGSLFGFLMAPFVASASALIASERLERLDRRLVAGGVGLSIVALLFIVSNVGLDGVGNGAELGNTRSRTAIFATTSKAIVDFAPFGSGFGTFEKVYPLYESTEQVPETYVNHAHNEYLEIVLELGAPGAVLVAALIVWLGVQTVTIWFLRRDFGSLLRIKMAASLSLLVPVLHSMLDYPLRTEAVACFAAVCVAILIKRREVVPEFEKPRSAAEPSSNNVV